MEVTNGFLKSELYGRTLQLRRAVVSIPSNIAEGTSRKGKIEFKQFLFMALSCGSSIETQIIMHLILNF
jgi:four helix bundle protein